MNKFLTETVLASNIEMYWDSQLASCLLCSNPNLGGDWLADSDPQVSFRGLENWSFYFLRKSSSVWKELLWKVKWQFLYCYNFEKLALESHDKRPSQFFCSIFHSESNICIEKKWLMPSRNEFLESISQAFLKPILSPLPCCCWYRWVTSLLIPLVLGPVLSFCLHSQEHFECLIFEGSI